MATILQASNEFASLPSWWPRVANMFSAGTIHGQLGYEFVKGKFATLPRLTGAAPFVVVRPPTPHLANYEKVAALLWNLAKSY